MLANVDSTPDGKAKQLGYVFLFPVFFCQKSKEITEEQELLKNFDFSSQEFLSQGKESYLGQERKVKRKRKESKVK